MITLFILFSIFSFFSCDYNKRGEKAIEYFYPLQKGKAFIYRYDNFVITRKIEDVIPKGIDRTIVKIREDIRNKEMPDIRGQNFYTYEVKDNLIKRLGGIELKGPIKKGRKWKVKVSQREYQIDDKGKVKKGKTIKYTTKVWIDDFKEMDIFGKTKKCIVLKSYMIYNSKRSPITKIYCKGVGEVEVSMFGYKTILTKIE